jgi:hypothetical protein
MVLQAKISFEMLTISFQKQKQFICLWIMQVVMEKMTKKMIM